MLNLFPWYARWLALLALVIAACGYTALKVHSHDEVKYEDLMVQYKTFVADVKAKGDIAKKQADEQNAQQEKVTNALRQNLELANRNYTDLIKRLRDNAPRRSDGSSVPVQTCVPQGTSGQASEESVPLADYKRLEADAAYDAQTVMLYKEALEKMAEAGAIEIK